LSHWKDDVLLFRFVGIIKWLKIGLKSDDKFLAFIYGKQSLDTVQW
jgi:hypothetical protein